MSEDKKVTKAEQKRLDAQQATINQQKALARSNCLDLLDKVVAQVSLNREGHMKVQNAVQTLRGANAELVEYETGARTARKGTEEEG